MNVSVSGKVSPEASVGIFNTALLPRGMGVFAELCQMREKD